MTNRLSITPQRVDVGEFSTTKRYLRAKPNEDGSFPVPKGVTMYLAVGTNNYTNWRYSQGVGKYLMTYFVGGGTVATGDPDFAMVYPDE